MAEDELFHLVELMDPEDALGVLSVGAGLLPEAGGESCEFLWELVPLEDLAHEHGPKRVFRGGNEVKVLFLDLVQGILECGEVSDPFHGLSVEHVGRLDDLVPPCEQEVKGVMLQCQVQKDELVLEIKESCPGHLRGPGDICELVHVRDVGVGHGKDRDLLMCHLPVRLLQESLEVGGVNTGCSPVPNRNVIVLGLPGRDGRVEDVGKGKHGPVALLLKFPDHPLQVLDLG